MDKSERKKQAWLSAMADYVLEHGLNAASLRPLAKAAGTSDRMLIYHFGTKEGLIEELLRFLAERLSDVLNDALPTTRASTRLDCLSEVVALLRTPRLQGYKRVWLDIVSSASQGSSLHRAVGARIIEGFVVWLAARVPETEADPERAARALLTLIEGAIVMDAVDHRETADWAIEWLLRE